jgi:hypothetical protein
MSLGASKGQVLWLSDTLGNRWKRAVAHSTLGTTFTHETQIWFCDNGIGGACTVTAHFNQAADANSSSIDLTEYTGGSGFELVDGIAMNTASATSLAVGPTSDTCAAHDLLVSALSVGGTLAPTATIPSGWTADAADVNTGFATWTAHLLDSGSSAAAQTATWTGLNGSDVSVGVLAAFKLTGVASTAPRLVQHANSLSYGPFTLAGAFPVNTLAGSILVADLAYYQPAAGGVSVTDTQGLNWTKVAWYYTATDAVFHELWVSSQTAAAADTVSFACNGECKVYEFANLAGAALEPNTFASYNETVATGTSHTFATPGSAPAGSLAVISAWMTNVSGKPAGWILNSAPGENYSGAYKLVASSGVQSGTFTTNAQEVAGLIAAVGALGGGGGFFPFIRAQP